jgi:stage IV sporulation protein FB
VAAAVAAGLGPEALILGVVLATHELAHLVLARALGLEVAEIEVLPFGGVARVEGLEWAEPGVEATVALAGPLDNFLLLALGLGLGRLGWLAPGRGQFFLTANLALAVVNLLPALPLDGGRVLRAVLSRRLGYGLATRRLCAVGRRLAWLLAAAGAGALALDTFVPGLFVFAVFLYGAAREERWTAGLHAWRQLWRKADQVRRAGALPVVALAAPPACSLGDLVARLVPHRYHLIWVVDDSGRARGPVDEGAVLEALERLGPHATLDRLVGP